MTVPRTVPVFPVYTLLPRGLMTFATSLGLLEMPSQGGFPSFGGASLAATDSEGAGVEAEADADVLLPCGEQDATPREATTSPAQVFEKRLIDEPRDGSSLQLPPIAPVIAAFTATSSDVPGMRPIARTRTPATTNAATTWPDFIGTATGAPAAGSRMYM